MPDPRLYMRVANELRDQIKDGRLKPGAKIPPRAMIMREVGCCPQMVTRGLAMLADEGLIVRYPGLGWHVNDE